MGQRAAQASSASGKNASMRRALHLGDNRQRALGTGDGYRVAGEIQSIGRFACDQHSAWTA